ncbi:MAG: macro domain-containing protein [Mariniphaga sp.]|jgi:O-acetyl-ADP-ribose deacetylase (regulator of RNase III)|nr:macro domain-containing protein [Mariniphaga sp.]
MKKQVGQVILEAVRGDIANLPDMTAIVNAANAELMPGGGVAGAIHRAAGPGLAEECRPLAPIEPGKAVISKGHNLPNKYVIHCLGPVYGKDKPENILLADCYRNALRLADEKQIDSVAFPAISTGIFGYPFEAASDISLQTVLEVIPDLKFVRHIRFVLFGEEDFEVYVERLRSLKI